MRRLVGIFRSEPLTIDEIRSGENVRVGIEERISVL